MTDVLFGINVSTSAAPGADPVADAGTAEDLGFDFVSASDHPGSASPSYETWTLLAWIAAATGYKEPVSDPEAARTPPRTSW
jgi:alkanesulfonate monooxygenase SsuD/methylene tetrahydromethanopterin reductase-like flavin-dependent oxidoreductase (luciferase family)